MKIGRAKIWGDFGRTCKKRGVFEVVFEEYAKIKGLTEIYSIFFELYYESLITLSRSLVMSESQIKIV